MQLHVLQRFQMIIVGIVCLLALLLVTACAGVASTGGNSRTITGTLISVDTAQHSAVLNVTGQQVTVTGLTDQQVATLKPHVGKTYTLEVTGSGNTVTISANANLELDETATPQTQATAGATQSPTAFVQGSINFMGKVQQVSNSSIVVSVPSGGTLSMNITSQTDRSDFNGSLPAVGQLIKVEAGANSDGSFTATKLKSTDAGDTVDQNTIEYLGVTTSAVGADRVLHFQVGTRSHAFTLGTTTDLSDFGNNAQAITSNQAVKVTVHFNGSTSTVLKVEHAND